MRKKLFTFLLALAASVGMMNAKVTWNSSNIIDLYVFSLQSYSKEGVTLSTNAEMVQAYWDSNGLEFHANATGGFTFSNSLSKNFAKIVMTLTYPAGWDMANLGSGWLFSFEYVDEQPVFVVTWTGNAATVDLLNDESHFNGEKVESIVFYFEGDSEEPDPTYAVALKAGTANANKVTLSATSAVEGATITVTPDEEYEITAFKAKYNTTEEAASTLDPATGAYSFTMPAYDVTIEATIALKPVPEGDIFAGFTATGGAGGFNNEGSANLVDNKFTSGTEQVNWTKWCANDGHKSVPTGESESCWWIDFEADAALSLTGYILTTGNDTGSEHGRNPKNWVLKAKLDAGDAWTTIATVTNDATMKNKSFKDYKFFVDQPGLYQYFRFEVSANQGAGVMQLCELRLIGTEPQVATSNTLQLHVNDALMGSVALQNPSNDIFDFGDGTYAVPEGAEVTLLATPNDGYEFIGWKASSSICDFNDCEFTALPTNDNPLTFDMYNEAAFMAEFAAVAPQPVVLADCGLGWLNVPEGGVVGTIGHEDEIVLPQVNASLDFILAFQAHTATLRLGSTDESVLAVYGFNNFAVNGVGECDVYVVHDEDAVFAYDSAAFHVTVNPELTPQPAVVIGDLNNVSEVETFLTTYDGQTVPDLTINRPVVNNMYNTLCLPFHMDADQIAASSLNGVEIYEFVDADVTNDELYLYTSEQKHEIVAGRPYLVKYSAASQLDDLDFVNVTINNADLDDQAVTIKGVTFKGTFQPVVLGQQEGLNFNGGHLFLGQNNTLYWPNTNSPLKPFRAYFTVNVDAGQSAGMPVRRGMPAHIGGPAQIPTGVDQITNDQSPITNKVMINGALYIIRGDKMYDAQGQMVK